MVDHLFFNFFLFGDPLTQFSVVSETAVAALLKEMAPKSCDLYPIATYLFLPIVMINPARIHVVNESLLSGTSPTVFKRAIVKPLLKKNNSLGPNDFKSNQLQTYLIGCLSFLSCWKRF